MRPLVRNVLRKLVVIDMYWVSTEYSANVCSVIMAVMAACGINLVILSAVTVFEIDGLESVSCV